MYSMWHTVCPFFSSDWYKDFILSPCFWLAEQWLFTLIKWIHHNIILDWPMNSVGIKMQSFSQWLLKKEHIVCALSIHMVNYEKCSSYLVHYSNRLVIQNSYLPLKLSNFRNFDLRSLIKVSIKCADWNWLFDRMIFLFHCFTGWFLYKKLRTTVSALLSLSQKRTWTIHKTQLGPTNTTII